MSIYTDKNVPMNCPECPGEHIEEGFQNMLEHVREAHKNLYTPTEAIAAVIRWCEDAHDSADDWDFEHRLDRSIDADTEHTRHGV
jgi:hypothetical protein